MIFLVPHIFTYTKQIGWEKRVIGFNGLFGGFFGKILFLCKVYWQGNFLVFPLKLFPKILIGASVISILSFSLFKKIVLAAKNQSKPIGLKAFFTLPELFFNHSQKYS